MNSCILMLPLILVAGPAVADAESSIACSIQLSPQGEARLQTGQTISVQIAAVSQLPIDALEINGVRVAVDSPNTLLVRDQTVRLTEAGDVRVQVRVGAGNMLAAECESAPFTVDPVPVCGENQRAVSEQVPYTETVFKAVTVKQAYTETVSICVGTEPAGR